jgi:orotidine-5'-phosphate decarboxylase
MELAQSVINSGALSVRNILHEEPFVYSSGNRGPGYVMIKGLCGQPALFKNLVKQLANKLVGNQILNHIDFVDGNVTGGVVCGWQLASYLSKMKGQQIPFVYLRGSRKAGGHNELVTGDMNNPYIKKGMNVLIVEELVNYGETTINAVETFRRMGYQVTHATCILSYDHKETNKKLADLGITLIPLVTLPELLNLSKEHLLLDSESVDSYKEYLQDSIKWQLDRNMVIPENSMTEYVRQEYNLVQLTEKQALQLGAPPSKLDEGFVYWGREKMTKNSPEPILFVALDFDNHKQIVHVATELATSIDKDNFGFKINLDALFYNDNHHDLVQLLVNLGKPVFVDLKMWNGIRTMKNIIQRYVDMGVSIVNVYSHVGKEYLEELVQVTKGTSTKLFTLTVLTHYNSNYTHRIYGKTVSDTVLTLAEEAVSAGVDGIILPATELDTVKHLDCLKLCPGLRSTDSQKYSNQLQTATPKYAVEHGATHLVIGRQITDHETVSDMMDSLNELLD